jgi:hypothetical protein
MHRPEVSQNYVDRAMTLVQLKQAPPKISEDPSWFECRYCPFKGQCHFGEPVTEKNCLSCAFAEPVEGGEWRCNWWRSNIPKGHLMKGCDKWTGVQ